MGSDESLVRDDRAHYRRDTKRFDPDEVLRSLDDTHVRPNGGREHQDAVVAGTDTVFAGSGKGSVMPDNESLAMAAALMPVSKMSVDAGRACTPPGGMERRAGRTGRSGAHGLFAPG